MELLPNDDWPRAFLGLRLGTGSVICQEKGCGKADPSSMFYNAFLKRLGRDDTSTAVGVIRVLDDAQCRAMCLWIDTHRNAMMAFADTGKA